MKVNKVAHEIGWSASTTEAVAASNDPAPCARGGAAISCRREPIARSVKVCRVSTLPPSHRTARTHVTMLGRERG